MLLDEAIIFMANILFRSIKWGLCDYSEVSAWERAGNRNYVKLRFLVLISFSSWINALDTVEAHAVNLFHKKIGRIFRTFFWFVQKNMQPSIVLDIGQK